MLFREEREDADADRGEVGRDLPDGTVVRSGEAKVGERPEVAVDPEGDLEDVGDDPRPGRRNDRRVLAGPLPVPRQVVVPPVVDRSEFPVSAERIELDLDVKLDTVVERPFCVGLLVESDRALGVAEDVPVEPQGLDEVEDEELREPPGPARSAAERGVGAPPEASRSATRRTGTVAAATDGKSTGNAAGSKKTWSSAWVKARIRNRTCRGAISFRYAFPITATPRGIALRPTSRIREKARKLDWAVSGRRYPRSRPSTPRSTPNIMLKGFGTESDFDPQLGHRAPSSRRSRRSRPG